MKTIDAIIIHCSATRAGQVLRAKDPRPRLISIVLASVISEAWTHLENLQIHVLQLKGQHYANWSRSSVRNTL